jgi:opacity protein-like surface antigen
MGSPTFWEIPMIGNISAAAGRAPAYAGWRRSFALACALFLVSALAAAQAAPGSIEVGGGEGRFYGGSFAAGSTRITDQKSEADDDILRGFWLGAQLSRDWGIEVAVRRTATNLVASHGGVFPTKPAIAGLDVATIEALALRSWRRGNFLPYLGAGLGVINLDPDVADRSVRDTNRLAISAAAGARFYAVRWAGFRIDLRARATYLGKRAQGDRGWDDSGRWFLNGEVLAGVFFSFGGKS